MFFSRLVLIIIATVLVPASTLLAAELESKGLWYRPFKKAVYAVSCAENFDKPPIRIVERPFPFVALTYTGCDPENGAAMYKVSLFSFVYDISRKPEFSGEAGILALGRQGRAYMFGMMPEADHPLEMAIVFYGENVRNGELYFPVLPEYAGELRVGSSWEMKMPPVPFVYPKQFVDPPKDHALVRQKWLSTEEVNGFECAKIAYKIKETWTEPGKQETFEFRIDSVVYFAIKEGIVVMDTTHANYTGIYLGQRGHERFARNLILLHYEPLEKEPVELAPQKPWRYEFHPVEPPKIAEPRSGVGWEQPPMRSLEEIRAETRELLEYLESVEKGIGTTRPPPGIWQPPPGKSIKEQIEEVKKFLEQLQGVERQ